MGRLRVGVPKEQWELPPHTSVARIWGQGLTLLTRTCRLVRADPAYRRGRVDVWLTDGHQGPLEVDEPVVAHFHEASWDLPEVAAVLAPEFVERYAGPSAAAARAAARVLTVSESSRRQLVDAYGLEADHVRVAHNGVDLRLHRPGLSGGPALVAAAGGDGDRPYVLFVGTVTPRKNLHLLRDAMGALAEGGLPHALVLVAGPAPDRADSSELEAAATQPIAGRPVVNLAGLDDRRLAELMAGAAVLCLPSLMEGFGMPVAEAMACGTPVVVADRGALPEVVGDAGLVVDPDVASIAAGLRYVLDDAERAAAMSALGVRQARRYTWDAMVAVWRDVLHEAAGRAA